MWCDHPFSQRNETTECRMSSGGGGLRQHGKGVGKNLKKGRVGNIGVLIKQGVRTPLPTVKGVQALFSRKCFFLDKQNQHICSKFFNIKDLVVKIVVVVKISGKNEILKIHIMEKSFQTKFSKKIWQYVASL